MRSVRTLAGAAASVAVLTVFARIAGFGRIVAFSQTVGENCLSSAYQTANQVPNVLFEVVAGGVLAGVLVPVLAGPLAEGTAEGRARASRTASAVLTWSVLALVLAAAAAALLTRPIATLLLRGATLEECGPDVVTTAVVMLYVFLPQVPLYGVAVVLGGVLQAQRRFTAPATAPLVSSLVVTVTYLLFGALLPAGVDLRAAGTAQVPGPALAVLAGGTTLGVLAMALTHLPALRSQIRWRPTLRPAPGDGTKLRQLALAGLAVLLAQQAVVLATTRLANAQGGPGAITLWSYAWALFLLPYAVLAVPVATAVFPRLAAAGGAGDAALAPLVAATSRLVLLAGSLGAAVLAATALPVALLFVRGPAGSGDPGDLAPALVAFAPGLLGYGLAALLTRTLYAVGRGRAAATAATVGWGVVLTASVALVAVLPAHRVVTALALAHTLGLTVAGVLLAVAVARSCGSAALAGVLRATLAAVVAAAGAAVAGQAVVPLLPLAGTAGVLVACCVAAAVAACLWAGLVTLLDRPDVVVLARRALALAPGRGTPR